MLASFLAPRLNRAGIHYGWVVMFVAFVTGVTTAGAVGLPGAFILPLSKEFGWDTAQISSAMALRFFLFGLMAPFSAALIERYGMQRIMLIAIALIVAGLGLATWMTQLWQLVALWGVVIGIGTGLTALVMGAAVSTRWFAHRRGLVLGMLTAAVATGQLVFLPLAASLIESAGWRYALIPPIAALILAAALISLFMCDWPAQIGLAPFGGKDIIPAPAQKGSVGAAFVRSITTLAEGSKSFAFWILFATFFICGLSTNGLVQTHFIPLCVDGGMTAVVAASTLALMGVFDLFGTVGSGYLTDRYDSRWLLFWYYGLRGLSLLWLPFSTFTVYGLAIFGVFYGLDWIATVPPTVRLAGQEFGRERAGILFGWIFFGHQLGAAIAAIGGGLSRSMLDSYLPAFVIAGVTCLIAAGLILTLRRSKAPAPAAA